MRIYRTATIISGIMNYLDRGIIVGVGLSVLFGTIYFSINETNSYSIVELAVAIIIFIGIINWKSIYAVFYDMMSRKCHTKPYGYLARRSNM